MPLSPTSLETGLADVAPLLGSHPDLGKVLYALGGMLRASPSRLSSFLAEMDGEASLLAAARAARGLKAVRKSCDLAADLGLPDPEWCQVCAKVLLQSGAPAEHQAAMEGMLRLECGGGVQGTKARGAVAGARRR